MGLRSIEGWFGRLIAVTLVAACFVGVIEPAAALERTCVRLFEDRGPNVRLALPGIKRDPSANGLKTLKIAHYSLHSFDYFPGRNARPDYSDKESVLRTILFEKPDILTLSEMMNRESLIQLARGLGSIYEPVMIDGNEQSSVALLIRKSLPLEVKIESNRALKHWYMGKFEPLFTRDFLVVNLYVPGTDKPFLTLGASHFKAQKTNFRSDPRFKIKRDAQERAAVQLLDADANPELSHFRIFLGDMNTDVRRSDELRFLKSAGYQDALDLLDIPMERRPSHSYFPIDGQPEFWQTDAAFVSNEISNRNAVLSGYISPDRSITGSALERPRSIQELRKRGSDHKMFVIVVDTTKLR